MRKEYLKLARARIDEKLQDSRSEAGPQYQECQLILGNTIVEIMLAISGKFFRNIADEIGFYKEEAPHIWGLYMYYQELVKIEAARKFESPATFWAGLEARLKETETFFNEHHWICAYYYEGRTDKDDELFTRRGTHNGKDPIIDVRIDRDFTRGASLLSLMRQNELLREWLNSQLKAASGDRPNRKLKFHGTQTELLEVLKAMELKGKFPGIPFNYIVEWASEVFSIEINNHDTTLSNMSDRQDNTPFLTGLLQALQDFFEDKKPPKERNKSYLS